MGTRKVERGPVATRVAANVKALREHWRLSLQDLSERMRSIGRPMLPSGLSKLETGERRVDVDDLAALALALDTTPNRLLLPPKADGSGVYLTETVKGSAGRVWRWATGDEPLPDIWDRPEVYDLDRATRFTAENRPHEPRDDMTLQEASQHAETLDQLSRAVRTARDAGVPLEAIIGFIKLTDTLDQVRAGTNWSAAYYERYDVGGGDDG